ncbi:MAG: cache domain-containing protein [Bdellovibrio sp.]
MLTQQQEQSYQINSSEIISLVSDAASLVLKKGEEAFKEFSVVGSRWRKGEIYIFVLDPQGNMLVHPDPNLEGKNVIDLKDINGKPIIQGLIEAATAVPSKPEGWYHYQWPVPGGILPRWKSSYVQLTKPSSGHEYIVGCGVYNEKMERRFVVDAVREAVGLIEKLGAQAFAQFRDPKGPFLAKDEYVFVYDTNGVNLVLPPFPNLEGRNLLSFKDTQGKYLIREMLELLKKQQAGWVEYMWPKPGESVSTQKSAFVSKAKLGDAWVLVGSGVYLADAPKAASITRTMTAPELITLVTEACEIFQKKGEQAFPEFRTHGSKWLHDQTYFFVWSMDGKRIFHGADPSSEGQSVKTMKDILGRPIGQMILDVGANPSGEGWIHYLYPEPANVFPVWKSTFLKRIKFPDGKPYIVGCGIYNMQMDKAFIEDIVNRASVLVAEKGKEAFPILSDKKGPFVFMDVYVFITSPNGIQILNPDFPSLEGKNLLGLKDLKGRSVVQEEISAAMNSGSAWLDVFWFMPGSNNLGRKKTFVRKVQSGSETFIVGSGFYSGEEA